MSSVGVLCVTLTLALVPTAHAKVTVTTQTTNTPSHQTADTCRVSHADGVTWLTCPAIAPGNMLTIGANHVSNDCKGPGVSPVRTSPTAPYEDNPLICMSWDSSINASAYRATTLDLYGSDAGWANATATRLRQWGFNTAGAWSSVALEKLEYRDVRDTKQPSQDTGILVGVLLDMGVR